MIGYYVHHRGLGHLHRALAILAEITEPVTVLSSLEKPDDFDGLWLQLDLDTDHPQVDVRAGGALHWAPLRSAGLRSRMATLSRWIDQNEPRAMVVDVSVEVVALARLHGIPVVTFAQPGDRRDDPHTLGYRLSSAVIEPWPTGFAPSRVELSERSSFENVGAISRLPVTAGSDRDSASVVVMNGAGGRGASALDAVVEEARPFLPNASWRTLEGESAASVAHALATAALVFAHCGQNAVAEIAASRVPAILVAEQRPHGEQKALADAIAASSLPAIVVEPRIQPGVATDWTTILALALSLDGSDWSEWCDGHEAERAASIILRVAGLLAPSTPGAVT